MMSMHSWVKSVIDYWESSASKQAAHLLLVGEPLQQEVIHLQGARGQALEEPGVRLDLIHRHALARLRDQHPRQDVQALRADLHVLHSSLSPTVTINDWTSQD